MPCKKGKRRNKLSITEEFWIQLIEAVVAVEMDQKSSWTKWRAVANILALDLPGKASHQEVKPAVVRLLRDRFHHLCCEVKGKRQIPRRITGVSETVMQKMHEYLRSKSASGNEGGTMIEQLEELGDWVRDQLLPTAKRELGLVLKSLKDNGAMPSDLAAASDAAFQQLRAKMIADMKETTKFICQLMKSC